MANSPMNDKPLVVVVDDDEAARISITQMLRLRGYEVEDFPSAVSALEWVNLSDSFCIITDIKMPWMDGETFLEELKKKDNKIPVIIITGHGDIPMAVRCLKAGAYDFIEKPFEDDILLAAVKRAVEKSKLRRESEELRKRLKIITPEEDVYFGMIGRSQVMQDVFQHIEIYAKYNAPVLICGETGVGKELAARAIHAQSPRAEYPFVPVNAGALSESLLESELFGHARGAFTGAETRRDGKIVMADKGTLLLDEIESLSLKAQVQLLRVLEDGLVQPLGADKSRKVDIRLLATTKTDLSLLVEEGKMREDFYHRIMVLRLMIPPLRERMEDIPLLAAHFLKAFSQKCSIPVPKIPEETFAKMMRYSWPGNVRELKNAIERMVITSHRGITGSFEFEDTFESSRLLSLPSTPGRLRNEMEKTEKRIIELTLREFRGEIGATSMALGISRRALYERMKKYGLNKEDFKNK